MGIVLFSIPIYKFSEQEFQKKYETKKRKFIESQLLIRNDKTVALKNFEYLFEKKKLYRNYVIGSLDVEFNLRYIDYVLYLPENYKSGELILKNSHMFTDAKQYVNYIGMEHYHTDFISRDNDEIGKDIFDNVNNHIENNHFGKKIYYDCSQFNALYDKLDYCALYDRYNVKEPTK